MDYLKEIHGYYLKKCGEVAGKVALKTDLWNEVRLDVPGSGAIIGNVPGVEEWYTVEPAEQRLGMAREMFRGQNVHIVAGKLQDVEFAPIFDSIFCLGTANYMGYPSAVKVLHSFGRWLKPTGKMYLSAWLWNGKNTINDSASVGERFYHNLYDFEKVLTEIFHVDERELIDSHSVKYQEGNLVGYKARRKDEAR